MLISEPLNPKPEHILDGKCPAVRTLTKKQRDDEYEYWGAEVFRPNRPRQHYPAHGCAFDRIAHNTKAQAACVTITPAINTTVSNPIHASPSA